MQNIINEIQSGDITNNQLLQKLTTYNDIVVDDYNEVLNALEDRNTKLEEHSFVLAKQDEAMRKQMATEATLIKNMEMLKMQSSAFHVSNKTLEKQVSILRKEAKTAKEQQKRNLASAKIKDARIKKLDAELLRLKSKKDEIDQLNTIYSKGNDVLLIYPSKLTLGINGERSEQTCLLYTDRLGSFVTVFLDNDNEVAFSSYVTDRDNVNARTLAQIDKHCMKVSEEAAKYAEEWLIRVNQHQGGVINKNDLITFKD